MRSGSSSPPLKHRSPSPTKHRPPAQPPAEPQQPRSRAPALWLRPFSELVLRLLVLGAVGLNVLAFPAVLAFDGPVSADSPWYGALLVGDIVLWLDVAARFVTPVWDQDEGTLLDHTVLLLGGSQISSHNGGSFPMLLAGGRKLGFKHGQHIKWKGGTKPASDLYLTILQQMGCPVKSFKESSGPIGEILT